MKADRIQVHPVGYTLPETTGTAACTMIAHAHARLAVYAPPRMEMALKPWVVDSDNAQVLP